MKIRIQFQHSNLYTPPSRNCATLTHFRPIIQEQILEILNSMKKTTCDTDPCNIHFLIEFKEVLLSTWTRVINTSLLYGPFLQPWEEAVVRPLTKSSKLDRGLKTIDPSITYLSSPSQLKRLPLSTFLQSSRIRIYYLPTKVPTTHTIQQKLQC